MTQEEFIKKMLRVPWVNRAACWDEVDCFGLVIMYYRHVLGVELPTVKGYAQDKPTDQCWANTISNWEEHTAPVQNGLVFTCYRGEKPLHVGIVISPTTVMHCRGDINDPGRVEVHSIRAIKSVYGKITFHKLKDTPCLN